MLKVLLAAAAVGLIAAIISVWSIVIRRWSQGLPLVEREPYNAVPWGLLDVVVAIALLFTFSILATSVVNQQFGVTAATPPEDLSLSYYRWNVTGMALVSLATLITVSIIILLRCRVSLGALGFVPQTAWRDVRLGMGAFLVLAPPIYALQLLLVQWVDSKHPVVELLRKHSDPGLILASVVSAVFVAPVLEEFLFRGLLQGWLEKLVSYSGQPVDLLLGATDHRQLGKVAGRGADAQADGQQSGDCGGATRARLEASPIEPDGGPRRTGTPDDSDLPIGFARLLPILASSSLFAVMHVAHGPDWIPLFFLALGDIFVSLRWCGLNG